MGSITGKGGYNALCDVCGWKYKASQLRKRWDGLIVCEKDWEMRHPSDLFKTVSDQSILLWTRPDEEGESVAPALNTASLTFAPCSGPYKSGIADVCRADCARADIVI
jgi:hypothetical protein